MRNKENPDPNTESSSYVTLVAGSVFSASQTPVLRASTQFSCGEGELAPKPVSTLFQIRREVRLSNVVVRTHHMVQLWEHCLRTLGA